MATLRQYDKNVSPAELRTKEYRHGTIEDYELIDYFHCK